MILLLLQVLKIPIVYVDVELRVKRYSNTPCVQSTHRPVFNLSFTCTYLITHHVWNLSTRADRRREPRTPPVGIHALKPPVFARLTCRRLIGHQAPSPSVSNPHFVSYRVREAEAAALRLATYIHRCPKYLLSRNLAGDQPFLEPILPAYDVWEVNGGIREHICFSSAFDE